MFGRLFAERAETRSIDAWGPWPGDGVATWAGMNVTTETASQLLAVYGSVRLIADSISTLPVDCFRRRPDGSREELAVPDWIAKPTVDLDFADWCGQVLWSLLMNGNAYVAVQRAPSGGIVELVPVDPEAVTPVWLGGRKRYLVGGTLYSGELRHIKGLSKPGSLVGLSPLEQARQSIGLGLAATEYGAKFFDGEANMPGVIEAPGPVQPDVMRNIAEQWARKRKRAFKGTPGVLQGGMAWKATGVTNEQAQFLGTRQWTAAEIAGQVFLLDPSDLGIPVQGTSLTYSNLADRNARRVQVALRPWIVRLESFLSDLMSRPRYAKLNVEGLLRGNPSERYSLYETASRINTNAAAVGQAPLLTTAEMRVLEDLPPLPEPEPVDVEDDAQDADDSAERALVVQPSVTVNMAEQRAQPLPPPSVNVPVAVHLPEQRFEPIVNVTVPDQLPPNVTVTTEPTPVVVNIESRRTVRTVERDEAGRIVRVVDDEVMA